MMNRWVAFAVVLTAWLAVGCTGSKGADRGGLMLVVADDGTTGIDMLHIVVSANGAVIKDQPYRVPQEASLPTTLGIVSNGDPALLVSITVIGLSGTVPIDRRDITVTGVPVDHVGTLHVVLSARCKGKVSSDPNGQVTSSCLPGTTCDPASENCVDANVMGSALPTFNGDLDATAPSVDTTDASGDEVSNDGGLSPQGDAGTRADGADGSVPDVPCTANFKKCGGRCVGFDDPAYGCGPTACTPVGCPAVPDGGTLVCQGGACVPGTCAAGTKKCGATCAALDDPKFGCAGAACDSSGCPDAGAGTLVCKAGACAIGACGSGLKDCGGQCVAISDPAFGCGATTCDNSTCPAAGTATLACGPNGCGIGTCGPGTKKCGAKCVSIADPTYGCGAATCDATSCPPPGAGTLTCQSGACVVGACTGGTKKCGSACVTPDANNGCGDPAVCTACAASESCVGSPVTKCACVPDNVTACKNKNCGPATNNCGGVVSCGTCASPNTCGGAAIPNKCGCTGTNPCTGGKCGKLDDGCGNSVTCGCSGTDTCGGGGTSGVCGCTPVDPCTGGKCGTFSNGCGKSVLCGCASPNTCGGGGTANLCGCTTANPCTGLTGSSCGTISIGCNKTTNCACTAAQNSCSAAGKCVCNPNTSACGNAQCGTKPDGCGNNVPCGSPCKAPLTCNANMCTNTMCPTSCPAGDDCGSLSTPGCTTLSCGSGSCGPSPHFCNAAAGQPGQCKCNPFTVAQACAGLNCGQAPDGCGQFLNCGSCQPTFVCNGGTCGCSTNRTACGNACIDTTGDPLNCGACGHSCLGGECIGSTCQPVIVASGQDHPGAIALDSHNVATTIYWVNSTATGAVMRCTIASCNPTPLATNLVFPTLIAAAGGNLFWTGINTDLTECAVNNCANTTTSLVSGVVFPGGIAVDNFAVYFTQTDDSSGPSPEAVDYCPVGGCSGTPLPVATNQIGPSGVAVDANNVYWTVSGATSNGNVVGAGAVMKCAKFSTCVLPPLAKATPANDWSGAGIAIDATTVYWTQLDPGGNTSTIASCPISGCPGGGPNVLAVENFRVAGPIAVDSSGVYWTGNTSLIRKCPLAGCPGQTATTIASGQNGPYDIAVDKKAIYWANAVDKLGTVMMLAK